MRSEHRRASAPRRPRCSRPASPRSPTRPPPRSSAARSAGSRRAAASPCGSALLADGVGSMHGVTRTLEEIRERGVPGFEVEVIGTDPHVDRRLPAVAEVEIPYSPGLRVGVPGVPAIVDALAEGRYELLHVCAPGPVGVAGALGGTAARPAGRRLVPHGAGRLRAAALGRPARRARDAARARRVLRPVRRRALARRPRRTTRSRELGIAARPDRPLGPRRRRRPLLARAARSRPHAGRPRRRALRRPPHAREGRRPARRRVRRGPGARPAAAPRGRRRRAGGGAAARAARPGGDVPRLARRGRARDRLRVGRPVPASARRPTRSGRWCSRRRRPASRSSPSRRAARPSWSRTAAAACCARRARRRWPTRSRASRRSRAMRERLARGGLAAVRDRTWEASLGAPRRGLAPRALRRRRRRSARRMTRTAGIAVAIHDVEPATFERCALIRDWLADHGIDRATLLVIPAPDLHPFFQRRPDLAAWLLDCRDRGDAVAQHGFQHRRAGAPRRGGAEFAGMDADATRASIEAGRRVLSLAGVEPRGFVAPEYAYTPALRRELADGFDWWATLLRLVGRDRAALSPALSLRRSPLGGPRRRVRVRPAAAPRPPSRRLRPPAPRAGAGVRPARRRPALRGDLRRLVLTARTRASRRPKPASKSRSRCRDSPLRKPNAGPMV